MMRLKHLVAAACMAAAPLANAHFIWLELDADTPELLQVRFSEEPLEETTADLQAKAAPMAIHAADASPIATAIGEGALEGKAPADTPLVAGTIQYGVMDRGGEVYMLVYHAKGTRGAEPAAKASGLPVEIVGEVKDDALTITVLHDGKPVADSALVAVLPQELEHVEGKTDAAGQATFPLTEGGWVGIRAMVPVEGAGEHDGKTYERSRHYSTLTFEYAK